MIAQIENSLVSRDEKLCVQTYCKPMSKFEPNRKTFYKIGKKHYSRDYLK